MHLNWTLYKQFNCSANTLPFNSICNNQIANCFCKLSNTIVILIVLLYRIQRNYTLKLSVRLEKNWGKIRSKINRFSNSVLFPHWLLNILRYKKIRFCLKTFCFKGFTDLKVHLYSRSISHDEIEFNLIYYQKCKILMCCQVCYKITLYSLIYTLKII